MGSPPSLKIQVIAILISLIAFLYIFYLVRQKKLQEGQSILWLLAAFVTLVFAVWDEGFIAIAALLEVHNAALLIYLFAIFFLLFHNLYLASKVSKLTQQNHEMAQHIGLLKIEMTELKKPSTNFA